MTRTPLHNDAINLQHLISSPEKWTQHVQARDDIGRQIDATSVFSTCWCLLGGISSVGQVSLLPMPFDLTDTALHGLLATIIREKYPQYVSYNDKNVVFKWNDDPFRTFEEVKDLLAEAVRRTAPEGGEE